MPFTYSKLHHTLKGTSTQPLADLNTASYIVNVAIVKCLRRTIFLLTNKHTAPLIQTFHPFPF